MPAKVLIIVPVFNEAPEILLATLTELSDSGYRILVVDDGSQPAVLPSGISAHYRLLRHPVNLGQGAALQTGMEFARRGDYGYVVHFDADGQHSAASIAALLGPVIAGEADVVLGSRFMSPRSTSLIPFVRKCTLRLGRIFNGLVTGVWMSDAHIGLRAMNRRAFSLLSFRENRMAHATELLWQMNRHGLSWREIPVDVTYTPYSRKKGQSSWDAFRIAGDVLLRMIYR